MNRYYSRINWENEPSTATPLDEDNLNLMDAALYEIDGRVVENRGLIENLQNYETRAAQSATDAEASANSAATSKSDAEAYAVGKRNGTDVASTDPTYHNNSKYYAEQADDSATLSESWAVGGTGTRQGEDTNNAKYWCDQAQAIVGITDFVGATESTAGVHGLVPAPSAGDQNKCLKGDGTWGTVKSSALEIDSGGFVAIDYSILGG